MLEKASTPPIGRPSLRVSFLPLFCAAANIAKYARKMYDEPSTRKTWSPLPNGREAGDAAAAADFADALAMAPNIRALARNFTPPEALSTPARDVAQLEEQDGGEKREAHAVGQNDDA